MSPRSFVLSCALLVSVSGCTDPAMPPVSLTITRTGLGTGTVTSSPAGIVCGATCTATFAVGTPVVLTASPDAGSVFPGWTSGGCSGTGSCTVTMDTARTIAVTFSPAPPTDFTEIEPNDDGAVGVGTNDFSSAAANGPFGAGILVHGAISPVGDDDVFAVNNSTAAAVVVRFDVYNPVIGIGVSCGGSIDTHLTIRDAAGTGLASNDDRSSADLCSGLSFTVAAGQTVYAHLIDFGDNTVITAYRLRIQF